MKKLFWILFLFQVSFNGFAQIRMGLKVAPQLNWSVADNKTTSTSGTKLNVSYGLMMDYYFTENYAFAVEVLMQTLGTNLTLPTNKYANINFPANSQTYPAVSDLTYDYRLTYVHIPVLIKMRTKSIGSTRIYGEFGTSFSFLTKAKADLKHSQFTISNINVNDPDKSDEYVLAPTNYEDDVANLMLSLIFGAGVQYNAFGNSLIVAGVRYDSRYTNLYTESSWRTKVNGLALNMGLLF
jgi:hypothetical protein